MKVWNSTDTKKEELKHYAEDLLDVVFLSCSILKFPMAPFLSCMLRCTAAHQGCVAIAEIS